MTKSAAEDKPNMARVMIAAASSGSGKTVITCGLLELLKQKGYDPVSFKCGPDYIDPMFHRTVLGIDSQNLDTYLAGADGVRQTVAGCESIAVIEGVMGIYDGLSPDSDDGSCYEIARITDTPIILVVNAAGVGRTVISIIKGILSDDDEHLIKGIILNRMSAPYFAKIRDVIESEIAKTRDDVRIVGFIPKSDEMRLESRYLGLVLPGEMKDLKDRVRQIAEVIDENCDVNVALEIMRTAKSFRENPVKTSALGEVFSSLASVTSRTGARAGFRGNYFDRAHSCILAVARDEAFCFYYEQNLRLLEQSGVEIEFFSPIHDTKLPDGVSGLLLGGGYPELHLKALASNTTMKRSIKEAIESGMPSLAECGGFMYLHRAITGTDKKDYEMVGAVDGVCAYTGHLVEFGYASISGSADDKNDMPGGTKDGNDKSDACDLRAAFAGMRGHEFHYYDSTCVEKDMILIKASTQKRYESMVARGDSLWGFLHLYYPSRPEAVKEFIERMKRYEER
ncbi:MAG: cobyrinate a,c-diamide synthase [Lachnospiraceae bacterium]|nr:cobyrinate a,c-diamide synthase [Lachnospiraceae bacterium]